MTVGMHWMDWSLFLLNLLQNASKTQGCLLAQKEEKYQRSRTHALEMFETSKKTLQSCWKCTHTYNHRLFSAFSSIASWSNFFLQRVHQSSSSPSLRPRESRRSPASSRISSGWRSQVDGLLDEELGVLLLLDTSKQVIVTRESFIWNQLFNEKSKVEK